MVKQLCSTSRGKIPSATSLNTTCPPLFFLPTVVKAANDLTYLDRLLRLAQLVQHPGLHLDALGVTGALPGDDLELSQGPLRLVQLGVHDSAIPAGVRVAAVQLQQPRLAVDGLPADERG